MDYAPVYVPSGPHYLCGLCGEVIADGCDVHGTWDDTGALTSVQVVDGDGNIVHQCGVSNG